MFINPHLEVRLADHRIHEAVDVAKLDCLLKGGHSFSERTPRRSFEGLLALSMWILIAPLYLGSRILRKN
jgi:hypothetical protein